MFLNSLKQESPLKTVTTTSPPKKKNKVNTLSVTEKKKKKKPSVYEKEQQHLEHVVLGDESILIERLYNKQGDYRKELEYSSTKSSDDEEEPQRKRKPVWNDDDDDTRTAGDKIAVVQPTSGFASHTPKWAELSSTKKAENKRKQKKRSIDSNSVDSSDDCDDDNDSGVGLSRSTGNYLLPSTATLPSINIQIKKCSDLNKECSAFDLSALEFHNKSSVALTAGSDYRFHLFQVDGEQNRKIHSVFLERFAIQCAHFTSEGDEIIFGSGHKYFSYFNLESAKLVRVPSIKNLEENKMSQFVVSPEGRFIIFLGANGYMHMLSARTKEHLTSLKMNGTVQSVAFSPDGTRMYSFGSDGQVYVWDMDNRSCIHKFYDDGCVKGMSLAVAPNNKYLACGSDSGVVNVYNLNQCMDTITPKPHKSLMKLTTACTSLKFNHTSELLATASNRAEKGVKLVHLPSFTVFRNFPERMDKGIRFPISMDVSPNSGYLTIGSNNGRALLYRLKHFSSY